MKARVEATANILVIAVALVAGYTALTHNVGRSAAPRDVAVGERLPAIAGIDWSRHRSTLVLALNSSCHYCQESAPFYRKLSQAPVSGGDLEIVALFPNDPPAVRRFNTELGLHIRSLPAVALEKLDVVATPTLLLVDREGRVERAWIGVLTPRQELDVLALASVGTKTGRLSQ